MVHRRQYFVKVLSGHCLWSVAVAVVAAAVFVLAVVGDAVDLVDVDAVDFVVDAAAGAGVVMKKAVLMPHDAQSLDVRAPEAVHVEVVASIVFVMLVLPS